MKTKSAKAVAKGTTLPGANADEILNELKANGGEGYKRILLNHGIPEPVFGVKIEVMKTILKRVGTDYRLALDLYDTGVYDAMYLAGLIADDEKMTKADLRKWLKNATSPPNAEYTVAWVAAGSPHGWDLARAWVDSKRELDQIAGWTTLSGLVALTADEDLDLTELRRLLDRVKTTIHDAPNRVRYSMNSFVIALGCYVPSLTAPAVAAAKAIGPVTVDMGNTACVVPDAAAYIKKVEDRGTIGKKRKTVKC